MATAEELLATLSSDDDVIVINNDLRTINIPSSIKHLGVESDENVLRLRFRMPRMYGEVDLSEFLIHINYMNANNEGDIYAVDDSEIGSDAITFSWLVGRNAVAYKGTVLFIVCLKLFDENGEVTKEYNTTIESLSVLEGLETTKFISEQHTDIVEQILYRLNYIEQHPIVPNIGDNGNWFIGDTDTGFSSKGDTGPIGPAGNDGSDGKPGADGITPHIGDNGNWFLGDIDTGIYSKGTAGKDGVDGKDGSDGQPGADGITPHIGDNGNWFLGDTDTGKPSRGEPGQDASSDIPIDTTLSVAGQAADAAAVGEAIGNINSILDSINGEAI